MPTRRPAAPLAILLSVFMVGCASSRARSMDAGVRIGPKQLTPEQINGEVTSFADTYFSLLGHVADSYYDLERSPKERAQGNAFLVDTTFAVFNVASDPNPVTAMLDMIVLVSLTRWSAKTHWRPALGEEAEVLIGAMEKGYIQVWQIAEEILYPDEQQVLREIIDSWTRDNPDQRYVAWVRFEDFSEQRRKAHATKRGAQSLFGLFGLDPLANLDPTTAEIERSRMLAERTFFYVKRLPTLMTAAAFQVYYDIAATNEAAQFRGNLQTYADAARDFAQTAGQLPRELREEVQVEREAAVRQIRDVIAAEREAAIDQLQEAIAAERQSIVETLKVEEPALRELLVELRLTLDSGNQLATTLGEIMPPPRDDPGKPVDVEQVRAVVEQTTLAADGINQLVQTLDQALAPDDLEARLGGLDVALGRAEARGRSLVDRTFLLAGGLVLLIFATSVARLALQRRWGKTGSGGE